MTLISNAYSTTYSSSMLSNRAQSNASTAQSVDADSPTSSATATVSSGSRNFSEVAAGARAALDATYEELDLSSADYKSRPGSFRRDMFNDMEFDRRTLFAIASNEGGQFSELERKTAQSVMDSHLQDVLASVNSLSDPNSGPRAKAIIDFLDTEASLEEKASFGWAKERAAAQASYQLQTKGQGEDVSSGNSVVELLLAAYEELFAAYDKDMSQRLENMPSFGHALKEWAGQGNKDYTVSITI